MLCVRPHGHGVLSPESRSSQAPFAHSIHGREARECMNWGMNEGLCTGMNEWMNVLLRRRLNVKRITRSRYGTWRHVLAKYVVNCSRSTTASGLSISIIFLWEILLKIQYYALTYKMLWILWWTRPKCGIFCMQKSIIIAVKWIFSLSQNTLKLMSAGLCPQDPTGGAY